MIESILRLSIERRWLMLSFILVIFGADNLRASFQKLLTINSVGNI
ncbi:MAG: hypothetical protein V7785_08175 [Bermanella sp.]